MTLNRLIILLEVVAVGCGMGALIGCVRPAEMGGVGYIVSTLLSVALYAACLLAPGRWLLRSLTAMEASGIRNFFLICLYFLKDLARDTGRLLIVHSVILVSLAVFLYTWPPASGQWINWLSVTTAILALAIWLNDMYARWKESLPKRMTVFYTIPETGDTTDRRGRLVGGYLEADLTHIYDVRNFAQQLGKQLFKNELKLGGKIDIYRHATPVFKEDGRFYEDFVVRLPMTGIPEYKRERDGVALAPFGEVIDKVNLSSSLPGRFRLKFEAWADHSESGVKHMRVSSHAQEFFQPLICTPDKMPENGDVKSLQPDDKSTENA